MCLDVRNAPFSGIYPHAMVGIDSLLKVVLFGSLPGSQKGLLGPTPETSRRNSPGNPKMTTLGNDVKITIPCGIAC